jgi:hypothetical protein
MKHTNSYLILKDKIEVPRNLRWMNQSSTWNDSRTHYFMQQATSDDVFFKLNSLNTLSVWILRWTLEASVTTTDESNFVKANQNQLNARSRDDQSMSLSPTSIENTKDTSDCYVPSPFEQIRPTWVLMSIAHG